MWTMMLTYPLMAFEVLTGFTLLLLATQSPAYPYLAVSLAVLAVTLLFTLMYLDPLLKRMTGPADEHTLRRFLRMHRIRTAAYSLRLLLFIIVLLASA